jgi:Zn-dependent peptidase ImmA (M78 family)
LLNDVLVKQQWYREYERDEVGSERLDFVAQYKPSEGIDAVATSIRGTLAIDSELRRQAGSWDEYLRLLVRNTEAAGILVMRSGIVGGNVHRTLSVSEFRGFAIVDDLAPLIFINARDVKVAQIFTLAHELAHVWIGASGVSNPDPGHLPPERHFGSERTNEVEQFCNAVAAEVLVPAKEFLDRWLSAGGRDLNRLAAHFRVSVMVVIRRAHDLRLLERNEFFRLVTEEKERQEKRQQERAESGGGNFYNTLPARNSARLTDAILHAFQRGRLPELQAARLLGVRTATLSALIEGRSTR